jgi:hypothetical protein
MTGIRDVLECDFSMPVCCRAYCDASATMSMISQQEGIRTKHLALRAALLRQALIDNDGQFYDIKYVRTGEQLADIFTKPLTKATFQSMCVGLGLANLDFKAGKDKSTNVVAKTMTTGGVAAEMAQAIAKALVNAGLEALRQPSPQYNDATTTAPQATTETADTCPTTISFTTTQATSTLTWQGLLLGAVAGVGFVNFVQLVRDKLCKKRRGNRTRQTQGTSTQEEPMVRDVGSMSQCSYDRGEGDATHGRFRYLGRLQVDEFQEHGVPHRRTSRRGA